MANSDCRLRHHNKQASKTATTMMNVIEDDDDSMEDEAVLIAICYQQYILSPERTMRSLLSLQARRNRSGTIRRKALLPYSQSPFLYLYQSGQDDAMITLTGFNYAAFHKLLGLFEAFFEAYTPHSKSGFVKRRNMSDKRGRPRNIDAKGCLGLYLTWTRTRGSLKTLQMIFGIVNTKLYMWLRFGRRILCRILRSHADAIIQLPSREEINEFTIRINEKYPVLENVYGAMDGLKVNLEKSTDNDKQTMFYNGWTHGHYVSGMLLFTPDGRVRAAYVNAPGCLHDSTLASWSEIYNKVDQVHELCGGKVVVDSAFASHKSKSLIKSHQSNINTQNGTVRSCSAVHRAATSVRQLSEWGMRGLQGSFPRLKDDILFEDYGERKLILFSIIYLYNFRATNVGQNQIKSTFTGLLAKDVAVEFRPLFES